MTQPGAAASVASSGECLGSGTTARPEGRERGRPGCPAPLPGPALPGSPAAARGPAHFRVGAAATASGGFAAPGRADAGARSAPALPGQVSGVRGSPGRAEGAAAVGTGPLSGAAAPRRFVRPPVAGPAGRTPGGTRAGGVEPAGSRSRSGGPSAEPRRRLRPLLARRLRPWGGGAERRAGVSVRCGGPRRSGAAHRPRPRLAVSVAGEGRAWRSRVPGQSRLLCPALLRGPRPRGGERCPGRGGESVLAAAAPSPSCLPLAPAGSPDARSGGFGLASGTGMGIFYFFVPFQHPLFGERSFLSRSRCR